MNNSKKKVIRLSILGYVLLLVSCLITGFLGISDKLNGFRAAINNYFNLWLYHHFVAYVAIVMIFIAITAFLVLAIIALKKKRGGLILPILGFALSLGFLAFVFVLVIPNLETGVLGGRLAILMMCGVTGLVIFSIIAFMLAFKDLLLDTIRAVESMGVDKKKDEPKEEEKEPVVAGLSEEEVRKIVEEYLEQHKEELHKEGAVVAPVEEEKEEEPEEEPQPEEEPAPAEEPAPEEEPEEEAGEEEEDEDEEGEEEPAVNVDSNVPVGLNIKGKRRRASFETRLKNSEYDIRHKYYDLRDYIKWYGLRNRISIPGDTFSYKRQRYAFITIVGKHIRLYINLNPQDYAESTIPVEEATAKKYQDLPSLLRIKSDLSYRRAKKLVDDLMQKIGLEKPDEDEPKETQKVD